MCGGVKELEKIKRNGIKRNRQREYNREIGIFSTGDKIKFKFKINYIAHGHSNEGTCQ